MLVKRRTVQLHTLQGKNESGETVTSFVASKAKMLPLKKLNLLHIELMGVLIGARIGHNLLCLLKMEKHQIQIWTDSVIVLDSELCTKMETICS